MKASERVAACAERLAAELHGLADKPEETPETTLCALSYLASGNPISAAAASELPLPPLSQEAIDRLEHLVTQRLAGIPLAHLTGRQRFMELEFLSGSEALIPRRETELLGGAALEVLRESARRSVVPVAIDVCTGSGNLALAMAHHERKARVLASDLSADAIALARRNASALLLEDRVDFREGDLLAPFDTPEFHAQVDLLLCNPPYISSKKVDVMPEEIAHYEPRIAFDGGPLGIRIVQRLIDEAPQFLRPGGWLAFEVGLGQGPAIVRRLQRTGAFEDVRSIPDDQGQIRAVLARR